MTARRRALHRQFAACAAVLCLVGGCTRSATQGHRASDLKRWRELANEGWTAPPPSFETPNALWYVAVSPDGKYVAFYYVLDRWGPNQHSEAWVMTIDGASAHAVCTGVPGESKCGTGVAWFPDSLHLVYRFLSTSRCDLVVSSADGTHRRLLTDTPNISEFDPVPDPKGEWIAYHIVKQGKIWQELWGVRSSGGESIRIAPLRGLSSQRPTWDGEGSELFFVDFEHEDKGSIKAAKLRNGKIIDIRTILTRRGLRAFSISPNGKYILYGVSGSDGFIGDLFASEMSAVERSKRLAGPAQLYNLHWNRGSSSICFLRPEERQQNSLWKLDIGSGKGTQLANNVRDLAHQNAWTRYDQIVFVRDGDQIYTVRSDGTGETQIFPQTESRNPPQS